MIDLHVLALTPSIQLDINLFYKFFQFKNIQRFKIEFCGKTFFLFIFRHTIKMKNSISCSNCGEVVI